MNKEQFETVVERRIQQIRTTLLSKGMEYQNGDSDVFHNFKIAAAMRNITPEQALDGMLLKHLVSMQDIVNNTAKGIAPTFQLADEKLCDIINYYILLEGLLKERIYTSLEDLPF